ncbi:MAG: hypothetical protein AUH29_15875 [Candidatus Rokubacteria bacterium 13_1_40CM_69_27]|nr:MAG: hypothetical protein AUH29_15875 [Candidatus Rokubacteria bacterium 13_1_40CM_69_27]
MHTPRNGNFTPLDVLARRGIPALTSTRDMAKFIQICASQDDLFALDEDGEVYQYNFNTKTWVELVASRSHEAST